MHVCSVQPGVPKVGGRLGWVGWGIGMHVYSVQPGVPKVDGWVVGGSRVCHLYDAEYALSSVLPLV